MRALDFGQYDELVAKYGDSDQVHPLPAPSITQPSIVLRAHKRAGDAHAAVANVEELGDA
jgi:anaerobic dimethyl sulfoxide reductase subunit B (iron-sulfur subunit)